MMERESEMAAEDTAASWTFRTVNSLTKVYPDSEPSEQDAHSDPIVFLGETVSFQIAMRPPAVTGAPRPVRVSVGRASADVVTLSMVDLVPCDLPAFPGHDDGYDRDAPGLYPDLLTPLNGDSLWLEEGVWSSIWVDVRVTDPARGPRIPIVIALRDDADVLLFEHRSSVLVVPRELPPLSLINSHYIHCDSLAQYYGVEMFSEAHWQILERFMASAGAMGVNATMAPIWTPSLDTEKGGRRLKTQLLDISLADGRYSFGFDRLGRWLDVCRRAGIDYLEMAHFFTQWGAIATPSIYVDVDGVEVEQFGWHVEAQDPSYRAFLEQLMPELIAYLDTEWDLTRIAFHISDEPSGEEGLRNYIAAKSVVADLVGPCVIMESLSDVAYYDNGVVPQPVVATDAVQPFLARAVPDLWVYYCVAQNRDVANRFFALPSSRSRVIGHQLFAFDCAGFVHWGFNFYNSQLSRRPIDPFLDTTASGAFPGGDTFIVYPGDEGRPLESIRYRVFADAMNDLRAMAWLAELAGTSEVLTLIDTDGRGGRLGFDAFSYDPLHYLEVRHAINQRLAGLLAEGEPAIRSA
ncbi:DUF4091 domain-containing protein [Agromyces aerolatus]|uniref:DUF4091 domain-containing protein n=1 Tax=Agromyces sp. LY-1074 TaxID=3074080 RepID=UPI0028651928|nr:MULTISPECIES: DUF4091 domain-containing protein [unclassified Agromyces]MDR5700483.1 DUF4091 domain-containing protein [Agromyces sp. LY-1074]MDR5707004.1 DUF4091 domain-containing protein [Agromyces sp. LY-1358]